MSDLVERLRELQGQTDAYANNRHHSFVTNQQMARESAALLAEAADEIDRLREEIEVMVAGDKLRAALDEALEGWTEGAQYKGDYLTKKHGDWERIAACRKLLAKEAGK